MSFFFPPACERIFIKMHSIESRWDTEPKHLLSAGCPCALSLEILQSVAVKGLTSSSPLPIPVSICMMILVEKKITNRCAKSVYHSGEHVMTYTKTLCLFYCTKSIYHNGDQSLTLKPYVFFTAPRALILSQWAPKPCTLCLFYCTKCIYHTGDQNITLKLYVFFMHQEHLSQWGPKPYIKTLCLFEANELVRS